MFTLLIEWMLATQNFEFKNEKSLTASSALTLNGQGLRLQISSFNQNKHVSNKKSRSLESNRKEIIAQSFK